MGVSFYQSNHCQHPYLLYCNMWAPPHVGSFEQVSLPLHDFLDLLSDTPFSMCGGELGFLEQLEIR